MPWRNAKVLPLFLSSGRMTDLSAGHHPLSLTTRLTPACDNGIKILVAESVVCQHRDHGRCTLIIRRFIKHSVTIMVLQAKQCLYTKSRHIITMLVNAYNMLAGKARWTDLPGMLQCMPKPAAAAVEHRPAEPPGAARDRAAGVAERRRTGAGRGQLTKRKKSYARPR